MIWGEPGTNGQHAFYQLIHQGTSSSRADFIAAAQTPTRSAITTPMLLANFFAQTEALMSARRADEARAELEAPGHAAARRSTRCVPHKVFAGNRPTNSILVPQAHAARRSAR